MKKLLSLVAMLALAAAFLPHEATAGLRGAFDPITNGPNNLPLGQQTPALRPGAVYSTAGLANVERHFAFTSRSQSPGYESSREIWLYRNVDQAAYRYASLSSFEAPLLRDPTGVISYTDPAWSPDGNWLAYVKTDKTALQSAIYVQQYEQGTTPAAASVAIGSPILVVPEVAGVAARHPTWNNDGTMLAYDSNATGLSIDLYEVQVFDGMGNPAVGAPTRLTFVDNRAEQNPAWSPDGTKIAFDTNQFGPNVIEILDLGTMTTSLAETNFKTVSHSHPKWSSDGASIYYQAPQGEDNNQNDDIWKIDLATQAKCDILFDGNGDENVDVSRLVNHTADGIAFNSIYFESQAAGFGLIIWRANAVNSCLPPLPMGATISPQTINLDANGNDVNVTLSFPPETIAAGYQAVSFNGPLEGIRMRRTTYSSPLMMGLLPKIDPKAGSYLPVYTDHSTNSTTVTWARRSVVARLVALGLVNENVLADVTAYSNITGRTFKGYTYIHIATSSLAGNAVKLEQNSPNPFNPVTKIRFATSKAGNVTLRVYNVRGQLVKTVADRNFSQGMHEVTWDGKTSAGLQASSGVYYAKVSAAGGATDVIKMVMAK